MYSLKVNVDCRRKILEQLGRSGKDLEQCVELLNEWVKTQPHLPEIPNTAMLEFFLINNKLMIEKTKLKLDMYYSIRSLIPDFYDEINPKLPKLMAGLEAQYVLPMPKLIDDKYRLMILKITPNEEAFDPTIAIANVVNVYEIRTQEDFMLGDVVLFDLEHLKMSHVYRNTPMHAKIATNILENVYSNRVKEVHVINYPKIADVLMNLAKVFMKPKLFNRIRFHNSVDSMTKCIPLNVLPKDYGGEEMSLHELDGLWRMKLMEYAERFDKLDTLRVTESLRSKPMKDTEKFGVQGSFRKINVD